MSFFALGWGEMQHNYQVYRIGVGNLQNSTIMDGNDGDIIYILGIYLLNNPFWSHNNYVIRAYLNETVIINTFDANIVIVNMEGRILTLQMI